MPIVSSVIVIDRRPVNGFGIVIAEHVWDDGQIEPAVFEAQSSEDINARLLAMRPARESGRAGAEIRQNVLNIMRDGSIATIVTHASTNAQNATALREAFRVATQTEVIMIGDFLSTLSDATLQNLFSMTPAEVTALRANKLTPAASAAASIRGATGA